MELTDSQVRGWLANLYEPGALDDPEMRDVLRAHGRPSEGTSFDVSQEARAFLREMVEKLLPSTDSMTIAAAWRPYQVATLAWVDPHSHFTVARLMGFSSRQISREKARAIRLLRSGLENP